jgi:hypothetical protein
VAWGDADQDGDLDLLFGVGLAESGGQTILVPGSKVYFNENGEFSDVDKVDILASGIGPHWAAFGDGNGNTHLDIAIARSEVADENQIYFDGNINPGWESPGSGQSYVLAWGDSDSDGDLDLLIGQNGPNILYEKEDNVLTYSELTVAPETDNTRSIAWGDYDNDFDLDFAVGNVNQPTRVYRNDGHNIFTLVWSSPYLSDTQSVAWGDYDGDGDLDLAEGNGGEHLTNLNQSGQANLIYDNLLIDSNVQNPTTPLTLLPVWVSTELSRTTSLAWGDWDNDGDLDLAVGNYGEADQVYANTGQPGASRFRLLWTSALTYQTTAIAWGDYDGDGDLDLAASQDQIKPNGFYENNYISPSHLESNFVDTVPLPNNPSYLSIERPGQTGQAYFYSSAEILSGPLNPTVTIKYRIFDPDGTRDENDPNPPPGDSAVKTTYEFSLDGGGYWQTATPASGWSGGVMTMTRQGREASFVWDAPADAAISDQALFRITIIPQTSLGQVQRASASAVSPPFRVRGLNCIWPDDPFIIFTPAEPAVNQPVQFMGGVIEGSGVLTFSWDFGDQTTGTGQVIKHTFSTNNTYSVTLTVTGEACPIAGQMITSTIVSIGTGFPDTFLPVVMKSGGTTLQQVALSIPSPVEGLQGHIDRAANATHLSWQPNDPAEAISEYRIYRRSRTDSGGFQLFDTVPGDVTAYTDTTTGCGHMYYITAFNARGESPPSTASYFSLPCR